jgi:hypothetical protein
LAMMVARFARVCAGEDKCHQSTSRIASAQEFF